jgi:hypothetical protein
MSSLLWAGVILFLLWPIVVIGGGVYCIQTLIQNIVTLSTEGLGVCKYILIYASFGWIFTIIGFFILLYKLLVALFVPDKANSQSITTTLGYSNVQPVGGSKRKR